MDLLHGWGRRLPPPVTRAAAQARRPRSSVSAVVTVTDANAMFLADCVDALHAQSRRPEQVVLVVTGAGRFTRSLVDAERRRAWRVVPREDPGAEPVQAAVREARRLRSAYLWLLDAGDRPAPTAIASLAGALEESGAPVAMQCAADDPLEAPPTRAQVMARRRFLHAGHLAAAPGPLDAWVPAVRAVLSGSAWARATAPVLAGPGRGTGAAFGAMPVLAPYAQPWAETVRELRAAAEARGDGSWDRLRRWLLVREAPRWAGDAERCTDEQWRLVSTTAKSLWEGATEDDRRSVPVEDRIALWLAAADRRHDLEVFSADRWVSHGQHPTRVEQGRVYAELPVAEVPAELLERAPDQTRLRVRVRRAVPAEPPLVTRRAAPRDAGLDVEAAVWIEGVGDDPDRPQQVQVALGAGGTGATVEAVDHVEVARVAGEVHQEHRASLVHVRGPVDEPRQTLELTVTQRGVVRTDRVVVRPAAPPEAEGALLLDDAGLDGDTLVVEARYEGGFHGRVSVAAAGRRAEGQAEGEGTVSSRVPLRDDPWSLGPGLLPPGGYELGATAGTGRPVPVLPGTALWSRLPLTGSTDRFRWRLEAARGGRLRLVLAPPLADDEVGAHAQHRLQQRYAESDRPLDPRSVYLQSYTGAVATDSPLAIAEELASSRPDLRLRWGVSDLSVRVPAGSEPVLLRSREWYDALATSAHVVVNTDLEWWWVRRPGQRVLQTFHGYPSKAMGISSWTAKNHTPLRVERLLRRTSGTWDLLLTPSPEMDVHYRRDYRYQGSIHSAGYPRNDALVGPGAAARRAEVRDRLGLADRTAVLYAPTWRDDLATNHRAAELGGWFDLDRAAAALGPGFVLLLRGHRFHRRRPAAGGAVVDVTDYPEINDLVLASDAAVLDYSSLRFDFALTGRPMLFLVPDLERYQGEVRGFLHDFAESAPGPLLGSTEEVVARLADLGGVASAHADEYAAFNRRFNAFHDGHASRRVVEAFFGPPSAGSA